ncbi:MAG: triose-phosphate isomerase [Rhodospirillales bacterium]|nr:triose-phosphate isomerase [Rhodospirillales bacterium]
MSTTRRPLIAGNWKMNGLKKDARQLSSQLAKRMAKVNRPGFDMVVCPPFPMLALVADVIKGSGVKLGAQDNHPQVSGAHTGDTSPAMLKNVGCSYAIVGHSERRTDHGESDALVKAKAEAAIAAGMIAIVCIGETLKQRKAGRALSTNRKQLQGSLPQAATAKNTVIAYEPVWAIGTGEVATPAQAQEVHGAIRAELEKLIGAKEAAKMRILYGGSMKPGNAGELIALPDVDGGLVGGAALNAADFWAIAEAAG